MRARDNPFATAHVHRIRYRLPDGLTWVDLLSRLESMKWRAAIVGPEGVGKTTLLEDFAPRLIEAGYEIIWLRLTQEEPRFASATLRELASLHPGKVILFDGAEQLSRWGWWRFLRLARRAGGLLITSHRSGLLPTLLECGTTPELLAGIVSDLLEDSQEARAFQVNRLFQKHRGNLRGALRELYDVFAGNTLWEGDSSGESSFTETAGAVGQAALPGQISFAPQRRNTARASASGVGLARRESV